MGINAKRLMDDLQQLRGFGAQGNGVVRLAFSAEDLAARRWLQSRMIEAGLDATIDGIGNVFGRSRKAGPAILVGSHSDTQPSGGWLDGAYGVICGLEVARALAENAATSAQAVDVVAWSDEEGTYGSYLGSRAFTGEDMAPVIAAARNAAGESLTGALAAAGLDGRPFVRMEPGRHAAYLEPHIEQGGRLEAAGKSLGIVTAIVGIRECRITFTGRRNHAGTTPMAIRRDAAAALFAFTQQIDRVFRDLADADTVWTVGRVDLSPGSLSVIPGEAILYLQFRDGDESRLQAMQAALVKLVAETTTGDGVAVTFAEHDDPTRPAVMDGALQKLLACAAEKVAPGDWQSMPSGAGHDAQILAPHFPTAMLFVPSIGGVSHDFTEDTRPDHLILGCAAIAAAIADWHKRNRLAVDDRTWRNPIHP